MTSQHYQHTDGNTTLQQLGFKNPGFLKKPSHVGCIEFCWVMVFMQGLCEWRLLKVKHIWLIKLAGFLVERWKQVLSNI